MNETNQFKLPEEVWNANWRDDVPEEKEAEDKEMLKFQVIGGDEKGERNYVSPKEISAEAEYRLALRSRRLKLGRKVMSLR